MVYRHTSRTTRIHAGGRMTKNSNDWMTTAAAWIVFGAVAWVIVVGLVAFTRWAL